VSSRLTAPARATGPSVVLSDLSFSWPNGRRVLDGLSAAFSPGRTGLIGVNGAGKSTLLALIAGRLRPSSGSVTVTGDVGYLPQTLTLEADARVASLLGIAGLLDAIDAIEAGDASQATFDAVGDDWDAREQAQAWLSRLGLAHVGLDDPVGRLSGGEAIMTALTALFLQRPTVLILDEPTNNLDRDARGRLYAAVESWPGVMLIVSHDRELLGLVDQIADLRSDHYGDSLRLYGGNLAAYQGMLAAEQAAARRAVGAAAADVRREHRDLVQGQTRQARRDRQGRQLSASGSLPHTAAGARQRSAQETAGRSRDIQLARIADARARLAEAEEAVRDDDAIAISLPGTAVPAGRTVLRVRGLDRPWMPWRPALMAGQADAIGKPETPGCTTALDDVGSLGDAEAMAEARTLDELIIRGPERIALTGPNGAGKTTLLRIIAGELGVPEPRKPGPEGLERGAPEWRGPERERPERERPERERPERERPERERPGHDVLEHRGPGLFVRRIGALGYLPQRLDVLDDTLTVAENVRAVAPAASVNEVRAGLARFLFRGARADAAAGTLSGGERFRAVLAALLLADPPPQFLLLDEPTNSLDLASVRQLSQALACYQGALLVASHDAPFLASIGITRWLRLSRDARLTDIDPLA
jgi:ATPase subunit of ABC transporter with duplicated ATPase domains